MFFNRIIFNPLISFCSAEFPLGSFTGAFRCVVELGIIQFTTSASLLVTAEHADQFVEDNRSLLLSYHEHAKAYERFFANNRHAVAGDIFLESEEDVHAAFRGQGQQPHVLCDEDGDDALDKVAIRAKRKKRLHDYFSKNYPNGFVDEHYK